MRGFVEKYISINLSDYPAFGFELQINIIIIAVTIALCIGCFILYKENLVLSTLIKRLIRKECTCAERALTIKDLGLQNSRATIRLLNQRRGVVRDIIHFNESFDLPKSDTKEADGDFLKNEDTSTKYIYIPEEKLQQAQAILETKNIGLRSTVTTALILLGIGALLVFTMPQILPVINEWLT
jgi:hypothetical protein